MGKALIMLLVLAASIHAEFLTERVDVMISGIGEDGSAKVHESIKFVMYGNYSASLYDSGISNNELAFWSTNIGLKDVKFHLNTAKVDIRDLRLRPQPRTKCNPLQGICHGELILDYRAYPTYIDNDTTAPVPGTGIFTIDKYKPRTRRYTINPSALAFTTTPEGNTILDDNVFLTIMPPEGAKVLDINPQPSGSSYQLPSQIDSLTWSDIVLVKFSLVFDVEDSIDKEVSDFFGGFFRGASRLLGGPQGPAVIVLAAVVIGTFLFITMARRRGEE
jgi:hypothetical protein